MVDGAGRRCCVEAEAAIELPRSSSCPGETRRQRRARAGPHASPPRRAPHRDARRATTQGIARWPCPSVPEPPRRPAVDPGARRRAGRGARRHRRPARPAPRRSRAAARRHRHAGGATPDDQNTPVTPSQLGVRPAPALVQQLLDRRVRLDVRGPAAVGGRRLPRGHATSSCCTTISQWWFLLIIAQFALVIVISGRDQQAVRDRCPRPVLRLRGDDGPHARRHRLGLPADARAAAPPSRRRSSSAAAMFGAAAIYGGVTKRDLAKHRRDPVHGPHRADRRVAREHLPAARASSTGSSPIVGVVIFTGLTAWDVQRITRGDLAAVTGSHGEGRRSSAPSASTSTSSTCSCSCSASSAATAS